MKFGRENGSKVETLLAGAAIGMAGMMIARGVERFFAWRDERNWRHVTAEYKALRNELQQLQRHHEGAGIHGQPLYSKDQNS
jgi:hypothetical protein